jgi:hypothetical protein
VTASFDKEYIALIAHNSDAKMETDLVLTAPPQVNGNGAVWEQLTDTAETEKSVLCKHLDGKSLFTCNEMKVTLQPEDTQGKADVGRGTETLKAAVASSRRRPRNQDNSRFARHRGPGKKEIVCSAEDGAEVSSEGTSCTLQTKKFLHKGGPSSIVPASEANLRSLQKELKVVVIGEFFQNIASGNRITTKSMADCRAIQNLVTLKRINS